MKRRFLGLVLLVLVLGSRASGQTLARCGEGWLEKVHGQLVLHVQGTPWEMGYQHGRLLREHVRGNLQTVLERKGDVPLAELGPLKVKPKHVVAKIVDIQRKHVPDRYFAEMQGLAAGAGVSVDEVRMANFIPELFHCSGFAVSGAATKGGTLYHGRVLDYAVDWGLQDHAVVLVAKPEGGIPFVNVTYAGFVGSVTGMNARHVAVGEMGGGGIGNWDGVPMAILVREVLQTANDLDEAIGVFRDNPRTCQYFYVVSDGKTNRAVGMEASWNRFDLVQPGTSHALLPHAVPDCVLLSAGRRYEELVRRVKSGHGKLTAETALRLMDRPVAMKSNLHNVLFEPESTRFWVAHAGRDGSPAAGRTYHRFRLSALLQRKPGSAENVHPLPDQSVTE